MTQFRNPNRLSLGSKVQYRFIPNGDPTGKAKQAEAEVVGFTPQRVRIRVTHDDGTTSQHTVGYEKLSW